MKLLNILILLLLIGCQTAKQPIIPTVEQIPLDPRVFEPCRPLIIPMESPLTLELILSNTATNASISEECRNKYNAAIVLLKRFSNVKEPK